MSFVEPKGVKLIASKLVRVFARIRKVCRSFNRCNPAKPPPSRRPILIHTTVKPLQHRQRRHYKALFLAGLEPSFDPFRSDELAAQVIDAAAATVLA